MIEIPLDFDNLRVIIAKSSKEKLQDFFNYYEIDIDWIQGGIQMKFLEAINRIVSLSYFKLDSRQISRVVCKEVENAKTIKHANNQAEYYGRVNLKINLERKTGAYEVNPHLIIKDSSLFYKMYCSKTAVRRHFYMGFIDLIYKNTREYPLIHSMPMGPNKEYFCVFMNKCELLLRDLCEHVSLNLKYRPIISEGSRIEYIRAIKREHESLDPYNNYYYFSMHHNLLCQVPN